MKAGMTSLDTICDVLVEVIFTFYEACNSPFPSRLRMILTWTELRANRKQQIKYLFKNYEVLKKSCRVIKKYGSSHSTRTQSWLCYHEWNRATKYNSFSYKFLDFFFLSWSKDTLRWILTFSFQCGKYDQLKTRSRKPVSKCLHIGGLYCLLWKESIIYFVITVL